MTIVVTDNNTMLQVLFCSSLLVAATLAAAPHHYPPKDEAPKPYSYQYGVADKVSKANFQSSQTQDAYVSDSRKGANGLSSSCFRAT